LILTFSDAHVIGKLMPAALLRARASHIAACLYIECAVPYTLLDLSKSKKRRCCPEEEEKMKESLKRNWNMVFGLFLLVLTGINIIVSRCGYGFLPFSYAVLMIVYVIVFVSAVVFSLRYRAERTEEAAVFGYLIPVIAVAFCASECAALESGLIYMKSGSDILLWIVTLISAAVIFFGNIKNKKLRSICGAAALILGGFAGFYLMIVMMFAMMGDAELIETVDSPDGKYSAFTIEVNSGAAGGMECVYVRDIDKDIFSPVGKLKTKDNYVVHRSWGTEMDLQWKDNSTFTVNGTEYSAPEICK
jgi:hypothetical protein